MAQEARKAAGETERERRKRLNAERRKHREDFKTLRWLPEAWPQELVPDAAVLDFLEQRVAQGRPIHARKF